MTAQCTARFGALAVPGPSSVRMARWATDRLPAILPAEPIPTLVGLTELAVHSFAYILPEHRHRSLRWVTR